MTNVVERFSYVNFDNYFVRKETKVICNNAFKDCNGLTRVVIPEGVEIIGNNAFSGCGSLIDVFLPDSLIFIGDYAFEGSYRLHNIELPQSLSILGNGAFRGCHHLNEIIIPASVNIINGNPFMGTHVDINCLTPHYKYDSNEELLYATNSKMLVSCMSTKTHYVIPKYIKSIGKDAFSGSYIENVTIPKTVDYIAQDSFSGGMIHKVSIQNPDIIVNPNAFNGAWGLRSIKVPSKVRGKYMLMFPRYAALIK